MSSSNGQTNFILFYKNGPELIRIESCQPVITSTRDWKPKDKHWTYVNELAEASVCTSERIVEEVRDHFCRFPWIGYRPLTPTEYDYLRTKRPKQYANLR